MQSSRLKTSEGKRAASAVGGAKAGSGAGAGTRALESKEMKSTKPLDSVIPPDDRTNTELNVREPSSWCLYALQSALFVLCAGHV